MKITIKDLREYRAICQQIDTITERLKKNRCHVVDSVQTAANFPYWKHTIPVEGDVYAYDAAPDKKRLEELKARKWRLEQFVAQVTDYRVRRCLEVMYLEPCAERVTWEDAAAALGGNMSGEAVRKMISRFFC